MFDLATLVDRTRRLANDLPVSYIDTKESTTKDSYYIVLSNEGYATVQPSGLIINGVVMDDSGYTVERNLIKVDVLVPADSDVLVYYDLYQNKDSLLLNNLLDAVEVIVEPIFNTDFEFGIDATTYVTNQDIDKDLRALFVYGTVLNMAGIHISETSGDAIYIKDGDTIIDTASSSREAFRGYGPIVDKWNELLKTVKSNRFGGVVQF